jgi:hypothetical protein
MGDLAKRARELADSLRDEGLVADAALILELADENDALQHSDVGLLHKRVTDAEAALASRWPTPPTEAERRIAELEARLASAEAILLSVEYIECAAWIANTGSSHCADVCREEDCSEQHAATRAHFAKYGPPCTCPPVNRILAPGESVQLVGGEPLKELDTQCPKHKEKA